MSENRNQNQNQQNQQPQQDFSGTGAKWTRLPMRTRPHRNPLASNEDEHPDSPQEWQQEMLENDYYPDTHNKNKKKEEDSSASASSTAANQEKFPEIVAQIKKVEFADIGCAFGGMLFALAPHFPDTLMLGLEIRSKVVQFAQGKTKALRTGELPDESNHHFNNVWFMQSNVMKFGDCFFQRGQLKKLFFCHPDPHWKKNNVRRRIIAPGLVQRYANWVAVGGLVYTVSDVKELEAWMIQCLDESPQFERVTDEELKKDEWFMEIVTGSSEDAKRAERKKLDKNYAVHRRIQYDDKKVAPLF